MQLFLICFTAGMLPCWLYVKTKNSWFHTSIGVILGALGAYAAIYLLGNFVQADLVAEMKQKFGESAARELTNGIYGTALKNSIGAIIGVAIFLKLKAARSPS